MTIGITIKGIRRMRNTGLSEIFVRVLLKKEITNMKYITLNPYDVKQKGYRLRSRNRGSKWTEGYDYPNILKLSDHILNEYQNPVNGGINEYDLIYKEPGISVPEDDVVCGDVLIDKVCERGSVIKKILAILTLITIALIIISPICYYLYASVFALLKLVGIGVGVSLLVALVGYLIFKPAKWSVKTLMESKEKY
jgi:hypothetical protein